MVFGTALFEKEVLVGVPFNEDGDQEEEQVHSEDEGHHCVEDDGEVDQLDGVVVLCCEVYKAQKEEQFGSFCQVEMGS